MKREIVSVPRLHPRVVEIRERLAAITQGEWEAGRPDMATVVDGVNSKWIYARKDLRSQYVAVASGQIDGPWEEVVANSQFIGHAPADVRWLLDALDDEYNIAEDRRLAWEALRELVAAIKDHDVEDIDPHVAKAEAVLAGLNVKESKAVAGDTP